MRGALVWLGEPDPCKTRQDIDAHDPEREALATLHRAWRDVIGADVLVTAKQLIDAASPNILDPDDDGAEKVDAAERLQGALEAISPRYSNPKVLGTSLSKYVGRIVDGNCIREHAILGKSKEYRLEIASG